jgi:RHS repeat-associated protein
VATVTRAQYVWSGRYVDAPVCRFRDTTGDGVSDETLYYLTDAQMNVTALVDANGAVVERCLYDAYGSPTFCDANWTAVTWSNSRKNEVLYCGYRYDPETGNYHVRNRVLAPGLGRWPQRDPTGFADGMNLYDYCRETPTGRRDWRGTTVDPKSIIGPDMAYYDVLRTEVDFSSSPQGKSLSQARFTEELLYKLGRDTFFPGAIGNGRNKFVYTCKYGFIDLGHFFFSAWEGYRKGAAKAYAEGIAVEELQATALILAGPLTLDWGNSAFTPEDLPSDWYGSHVGEHAKQALKQRVLVSSSFHDFLKDAGAVRVVEWASNDRAFPILQKEARSWQGFLGFVKWEARVAGGFWTHDYNTSIRWQKSHRAHECLCDGDKPKAEYMWPVEGVGDAGPGHSLF